MAAINVTIALQIVTLFIAAIGPFIAYRHSRKLALSEGRQAWLNELRAEIADLIAHSDVASTLEDSKTPEQIERYRAMMLNVQSARVRILLRLEVNNPRHERLRVALNEFVTAYKVAGDKRRNLRNELLEAGQETLQHVWKRLERGS